jgi:hypothetical protein
VLVSKEHGKHNNVLVPDKVTKKGMVLVVCLVAGSYFPFVTKTSVSDYHLWLRPG